MASKTTSALHTSEQSTSKDLETIKSSMKEQRLFVDWFRRRKNLSQREKAALECDSLEKFNTLFSDTIIAQKTFDHVHGTGCVFWDMSYQQMAASAHGFLHDFSPILDIVNDLGGPYTTIAIGTMSMFFAVAKNKNDAEKSLIGCIATIQARLPGLKLYEHIYNDDHELSVALQSNIVGAYRHFIEFCIEATKYYKCGGPRRWARALLPSNKFASMAKAIQEDVTEIRKLCEELLGRNVDTIKRNFIGLQHDNEGLRAQISKLQKGYDSNRLNEIQHLLNLDTFSPESHLDAWRKHVHDVDTHKDLNAEVFQQMRGSSLDAFRSKPPYQSWSQSDHPCLLIISGYNNESIRLVDHSWLSPVAAATIDSLAQAEKTPIHAYHVLGESQGGELLYDVLPVLLLQLLQWKSHALNDEAKYTELCAQLRIVNNHTSAGSQPRAQGMIDYNRIEAIERLALRVLDFFDEEEEVYIVVDRADRCRKWGREHPERINQQKVLLKALAKMVTEAKCRLKILVVINGRGWRVEPVQDELVEVMTERVVVHTAQQELAN